MTRDHRGLSIKAMRQDRSSASTGGSASHKLPFSDLSREIEAREHDLTMHVFAVSAGMVGVCLTAIGLLGLIASQTKVQTLGDELLAVDAMLFVVCAFLAFWSFKTNEPSVRRRLRLMVDTLFLAGLAGMGGICAIIAYAVF
jgi:hypothetical protein